MLRIQILSGRQAATAVVANEIDFAAVFRAPMFVATRAER